MDILSYVLGYKKGAASGGGGGSSSNGSISSISTAAEMDSILTNATSADVGKAYLYTGETTEEYENNAIYVIKEI